MAGLVEVAGFDDRWQRQQVLLARLRDLGFVAGARCEVIARMWLGGDPLVVRIGGSTFALRRAEAAAVRVTRLGNNRRCARSWRRRTPAPRSPSVGWTPSHFSAAAHRAGRQSQLRQDRAVQPADRQPPEGRELPGRHRRAQAKASVPPPTDRALRVLDLPGTYSLKPTTLDEAITRDVLLGPRPGEPAPELVVCVVDAVHLPIGLRLALEVKRLGLPMVLAFNRMDVAAAARHAHRRGAPGGRARRAGGADRRGEARRRRCAHRGASNRARWHANAASAAPAWQTPAAEDAEQTQTRSARRARGRGLQPAARKPPGSRASTRVLLHPVAGLLVLAAVLFVMFQAVFSWAEAPMDWIDGGHGVARANSPRRTCRQGRSPACWSTA